MEKVDWLLKEIIILVLNVMTGKERRFIDDDEENECFRKYKKVEDSYRDHSLFLSKRGDIPFLFELDITDYKLVQKD